MEEEEEQNKYGFVTVNIWEGYGIEAGHVSLQTDKHYISIWPKKTKESSKGQNKAVLTKELEAVLIDSYKKDTKLEKKKKGAGKREAKQYHLVLNTSKINCAFEDFLNYNTDSYDTDNKGEWNFYGRYLYLSKTKYFIRGTSIGSEPYAEEKFFKFPQSCTTLSLVLLKIGGCEKIAGKLGLFSLVKTFGDFNNDIEQGNIGKGLLSLIGNSGNFLFRHFPTVWTNKDIPGTDIYGALVTPEDVEVLVKFIKEKQTEKIISLRIGEKEIPQNIPALNLNTQYIGNYGAQKLQEYPFSKLVFLNLRKNNIGDEGVFFLVRGNLATLELLDLSENAIGDKGASLIPKSFPMLQMLFLAQNKIQSFSATVETFPFLTLLDISSNPKLENVKVSSPFFLKKLNVGHCSSLKEMEIHLLQIESFNVEGNIHLIRILDKTFDVHNSAVGWRNLQEIKTRGCPVFEGGEEMLEAYPPLTAFFIKRGSRETAIQRWGMEDWSTVCSEEKARERMQKCWTRVGFVPSRDSFMMQWAHNHGTILHTIPYLTQLTSLKLSTSKIELDSLAEKMSKNLTNLKDLKLTYSHLHSERARKLFPGLTNLTSLDIREGYIAEGVDSITHNLLYLVTLNIKQNWIRTSEAKQISESLTKLEELNISCNDIEDEGAEYIATGLINLKKLYMSSCKIGCKGALKVTKKLTKLSRLNLYRNNIGHIEKVALRSLINREGDFNF